MSESTGQSFSDQLRRLYELEQRVQTMQTQITQAIESAAPASSGELARIRQQLIRVERERDDAVAALEVHNRQIEQSERTSIDLAAQLAQAQLELDREYQRNAALIQALEQLAAERDTQAHRALTLARDQQEQERSAIEAQAQLDRLQRDHDEDSATWQTQLANMQQNHAAETFALQARLAAAEAQMQAHHQVLTMLHEIRPLLDQLADPIPTNDSPILPADVKATSREDADEIQIVSVDPEVGLPEADTPPSGVAAPIVASASMPQHDEQQDLQRAIGYLRSRPSTTHRQLRTDLALTSSATSRLLHTLEAGRIISPRQSDGRYLVLDDATPTPSRDHSMALPSARTADGGEFRPYLLNPYR